jgi:hypothetical protein
MQDAAAPHLDPLDLVDTHLFAAPVVELRRGRRSVVHHCRGLFEARRSSPSPISVARKVWLPSLVAMPPRRHPAGPSNVCSTRVSNAYSSIWPDERRSSIF